MTNIILLLIVVIVVLVLQKTDYSYASQKLQGHFTPSFVANKTALLMRLEVKRCRHQHSGSMSRAAYSQPNLDRNNIILVMSRRR